MKGQVRGLALELLRQDCVDHLDIASSYLETNDMQKHKEAQQEAVEICKLYDNALHKESK